MQSAAQNPEIDVEPIDGIDPVFHPSGQSTNHPLVAVSDSNNLRSLVNLSKFLGVERIVSRAEAKRSNLVPDIAVVWGRKVSGHSTLEYATSVGIPVWYLEDGWVRTCSEDAHSRKSYSLLVDKVGVYYDASSPSSIEQILSEDNPMHRIDSATLSMAKVLRERLVTEEVSKYNWHMPTSATVPEDNYVLDCQNTPRCCCWQA